jgi:cell division protein FtsB
MDATELLWLERCARRAEERARQAEMRKLAQEVREANATIAPLQKKWATMRQERMRMDGDNGFVMVAK